MQATTIPTQANLRQQKRRQRQALPAEEKQRYSQQIAEHIIASEAYQNAERLGAYLAMSEEVNVQAIIERAWADGKSVYLPVVTAKGQAMSFCRYTPDTPLTKDVVNMDVPAEGELIAAGDLDIVVTPLVAFDEHGNRIGMGGGYYDRTFAFKANTQPQKPQLFGVAFEVQRLATLLPVQAWDIRPDAIVSERGFYI